MRHFMKRIFSAAVVLAMLLTMFPAQVFAAGGTSNAAGGFGSGRSSGVNGGSYSVKENKTITLSIPGGGYECAWTVTSADPADAVNVAPTHVGSLTAIVTGMKKGTATITATYKQNGQDKEPIYFTVEVQEATADFTETLAVGETKKIYAATNCEHNWTSSDPSVVTVKPSWDGVSLTGVSSGNATVMDACTDYSTRITTTYIYAVTVVSGDCFVNYVVTGDAPEGYTAPEIKQYEPGDTVSVAAKPAPVDKGDSVYVFTGWSVSGAAVSGGSFTMPEGNVTFSGSWAKETKSQTPTVNAITIEIQQGDDQVLTAHRVGPCGYSVWVSNDDTIVTVDNDGTIHGERTSPFYGWTGGKHYVEVAHYYCVGEHAEDEPHVISTEVFHVQVNPADKKENSYNISVTVDGPAESLTYYYVSDNQTLTSGSLTKPAGTQNLKVSWSVTDPAAYGITNVTINGTSIFQGSSGGNTIDIPPLDRDYDIVITLEQKMAHLTVTHKLENGEILFTQLMPVAINKTYVLTPNGIIEQPPEGLYEGYKTISVGLANATYKLDESIIHKADELGYIVHYVDWDTGAAVASDKRVTRSEKFIQYGESYVENAIAVPEYEIYDENAGATVTALAKTVKVGLLGYSSVPQQEITFYYKKSTTPEPKEVTLTATVDYMLDEVQTADHKDLTVTVPADAEQVIPTTGVSANSYPGWTLKNITVNGSVVGSLPATVKDGDAIVYHYERKTATVTYIWTDADGNIKNLVGTAQEPTKPADITGNVGGTYAVDTVFTEGYKIDAADEKGCWVFSGWTDTNGGVIPENGGTITGVWTYGEYYTIKYNIQGAMHSVPVPQDGNKYLLGQDATILGGGAHDNAHVLLGWTTAPGQHVNVADPSAMPNFRTPGQTLTVLKALANDEHVINLYAVWGKNDAEHEIKAQVYYFKADTLDAAKDLPDSAAELGNMVTKKTWLGEDAVVTVTVDQNKYPYYTLAETVGDLSYTLPAGQATEKDPHIVRVYYIKSADTHSISAQVQYFYGDTLEAAQSKTDPDARDNVVTVEKWIGEEASVTVNPQISGKFPNYVYSTMDPSTTTFKLAVGAATETDPHIVKVYYVKDTSLTHYIPVEIQYFKGDTLADAKAKTTPDAVDTTHSSSPVWLGDAISYELPEGAIDTAKFTGYTYDSTSGSTTFTLAANEATPDTPAVVKVYYVRDEHTAAIQVQYFFGNTLADAQAKTAPDAADTAVTRKGWLDEPVTVTITEAAIDQNKFPGYSYDSFSGSLSYELAANGASNTDSPAVVKVYFVRDEHTAAAQIQYYKGTSLAEAAASTPEIVDVTPVTGWLDEAVTVTAAANETDYFGADYKHMSTEADATKGAEGYTFTLAANAETPDAPYIVKVFYVAKDAEYTVNYYWNGTTESVSASVTGTGKIGTTVTGSLKTNIAGYTPVAPTVTTKPLVLKAEGNVINFYYYKNVNLTANSSTGDVYDGTAKTVTGFTVDEFAMARAAVPVFSGVTAGATGTNAGTYAATFSAGAVGTVDTGDQYVVAGTTAGTMDIARRRVVLQSGNAAKQYDGLPLTNPTVTVGGAGFAKGEGAAYTVTGARTEIGSSNNTFTYRLNANTLAANYDIETVLGVLTVTPVPVHTLTVHYVFEDGTEAAPDYVNQFAAGDPYLVYSPAVEGYTPDFAFVRSGPEGMPDEDVELTVTYTQDPIDPPGGEITPTERGYDLTPVEEEDVPLAGGEHVDDIMHFLLIIAAFVLQGFYTGSRKKHQKKIFEMKKTLGDTTMDETEV